MKNSRSAKSEPYQPPPLAERLTGREDVFVRRRMVVGRPEVGNAHGAPNQGLQIKRTLGVSSTDEPLQTLAIVRRL